MATPTRPDQESERLALPAEGQEQLRGSRDRVDRPRLDRSRRHRLLRRVGITLLALLLALALAFGLLLAATPSTGDAAARVAAKAAAENAPQLGTALPAKVVAALVATEDSRFYHHSGVDVTGALRATVGSAFSGGDQGGATLDQQLVKILYTGGQRSLPDRVEQVALALKLDHDYSKTQILRMYLDTVYFGHGYYGITSAAAGYFGRTPAELSWTQASMLAGLVQAPSDYDPLAHFAAAKARQAHVLDRLVATHELTAAERAAVAAEPLGLR